jgi:hypothetical protein
VAAGAAAVLLPCLASSPGTALDDARGALIMARSSASSARHRLPALSEMFFRERMPGLGRLTYGAYAFNSKSVRLIGILLVGVEQLTSRSAAAPAVQVAALLVPSRGAGRRLDASLAAVLAVSGPDLPGRVSPAPI